MAVTDNGRRAVTTTSSDASTRQRVDARRRAPDRPDAQIRVHLRAIGHPVVGDRDYDGGRPGLDPGRPFLHAAELRFRHPTSGDLVEFEAPLPADLDAVLADCS